MTRATICLYTLFAVIAAVGALAPVPAYAQLGSRSAGEWMKTLDSSDRIQGLKIAEVVDALGLAPGQVAADIGAGTGAFTLPLARAVRPGGTALAVEVDQQLLEHLAETAIEQGVANVVTVHGEFDDPLLGGVVDLAFIHDVLHHIENREVYLKNRRLSQADRTYRDHRLHPRHGWSPRQRADAALTGSGDGADDAGRDETGRRSRRSLR